ncbi:MAG: polysaccharide deacetylase family protein [Candidatus Eisenbacteria bacterium]
MRHHRVYADGERALYHLGVSESILAGQVETCVRAGLTPRTVAEGLAHLDRGDAGQVVAFSFDDGYADNMTRALPILERYGARATCFLTAGLMESRTAPWWDELAFILEHAVIPDARVTFGGRSTSLQAMSDAGRRAALTALLPQLRVAPAEMRARLDRLRQVLGVTEPAPCELAEWPVARRWVDASMEVGSHTLTHPFLTTLPPGEQLREIVGCADLIRERLAAPVTGLAYPVGDHDEHTLEATRASGLAYAVTTEAGDCRPDSSRHRLARRALTEGACIGPGGKYSGAMTRAELAGSFDRLRGRRQESGT